VPLPLVGRVPVPRRERAVLLPAAKAEPSSVVPFRRWGSRSSIVPSAGANTPKSGTEKPEDRFSKPASGLLRGQPIAH
jgi:hypothetical protein